MWRVRAPIASATAGSEAASARIRRARFNCVRIWQRAVCVRRALSTTTGGGRGAEQNDAPAGASASAGSSGGESDQSLGMLAQLVAKFRRSIIHPPKPAPPAAAASDVPPYTPPPVPPPLTHEPQLNSEGASAAAAAASVEAALAYSLAAIVKPSAAGTAAAPRAGVVSRPALVDTRKHAKKLFLPRPVRVPAGMAPPKPRAAAVTAAFPAAGTAADAPTAPTGGGKAAAAKVYPRGARTPVTPNQTDMLLHGLLHARRSGALPLAASDIKIVSDEFVRLYSTGSPQTAFEFMRVLEAAQFAAITAKPSPATTSVAGATTAAADADAAVAKAQPLPKVLLPESDWLALLSRVLPLTQSFHEQMAALNFMPFQRPRASGTPPAASVPASAPAPPASRLESTARFCSLKGTVSASMLVLADMLRRLNSDSDFIAFRSNRDQLLTRLHGISRMELTAPSHREYATQRLASAFVLNESTAEIDARWRDWVYAFGSPPSAKQLPRKEADTKSDASPPAPVITSATIAGVKLPHVEHTAAYICTRLSQCAERAGASGITRLFSLLTASSVGDIPNPSKCEIALSPTIVHAMAGVAVLNVSAARTRVATAAAAVHAAGKHSDAAATQQFIDLQRALSQAEALYETSLGWWSHPHLANATFDRYRHLQSSALSDKQITALLQHSNQIDLAIPLLLAVRHYQPNRTPIPSPLAVASATATTAPSESGALKPLGLKSLGAAATLDARTYHAAVRAIARELAVTNPTHPTNRLLYFRHHTLSRRLVGSRTAVDDPHSNPDRVKQLNASEHTELERLTADLEKLNRRRTQLTEQLWSVVDSAAPAAVTAADTDESSHAAIRLNSGTYAMAVKAFVDMHELNRAWALWDRILAEENRRRAREPDSTAVLTSDLLLRDPALFAAALAGTASSGDVERAVQVYALMKTYGVHPTPEIFNLFLKTLMIGSEHQRLAVVLSGVEQTVKNAAAENAKVVAAATVPVRGVPLSDAVASATSAVAAANQMSLPFDRDSYELILTYFASRGDVHRLLNWWQLMQRVGGFVPPSANAYLSLIRGFSTRDGLRGLAQVWGLMQQDRAPCEVRTARLIISTVNSCLTQTIPAPHHANIRDAVYKCGLVFARVDTPKSLRKTGANAVASGRPGPKMSPQSQRPSDINGVPLDDAEVAAVNAAEAAADDAPARSMSGRGGGPLNGVQIAALQRLMDVVRQFTDPNSKSAKRTHS